MAGIDKIGEEEITFEGQIFEVASQLVRIGDNERTFEMARRAPGTRLIIVSGNKILLTKEFRHELGGYDYRLPGGKVFDTLAQFGEARGSDSNFLEAAKEAAKKECIEETGIVPKNIEYFKTSRAGATIQWDLYYFVIDDFEEARGGQSLELGEEIKPEWKTFEEVRQLIADGGMNEDRSVGVLVQYMLKNRKGF